LQVEEQLHADMQRYQSINSSLQKSREVTKKMVRVSHQLKQQFSLLKGQVNILGGFNERLTELEEVIRPVHLETITLTRCMNEIPVLLLRAMHDSPSTDESSISRAAPATTSGGRWPCSARSSSSTRSQLQQSRS
jgi:hypothetical protein